MEELRGRPTSDMNLDGLVKTMQFSQMASIQMVKEWKGNLGQWYYDVSEEKIFLNPLLLMVMGETLDGFELAYSLESFVSKIVLEDQGIFKEQLLAYVEGRSLVVEFVFRIVDHEGLIHHIYMSGKKTPATWGVPYVVGEFYDVTKQFLTRREQKKRTVNNPVIDVRDRLTGLMTEDFFDEHLRHAITLARAGQRKFSVLAVDVDFFKNINAHFGRDKGDEVLIDVGRILTREIRETDIVARMRDDRFYLILDGIDFKIGHSVAERIKKAIGNHMFVNGIRVTASGGFKAYNQESKDQVYETLVELINKSKHRGHNVMSYSR